MYNEFILFNNQKIFLNLKFEYGLFPKSFYSLINTINVKCDISKTKVELSTRAINSIFKIIGQLIKLSKINEKYKGDMKSMNNLNDLNNRNPLKNKTKNFNDEYFQDCSDKENDEQCPLRENIPFLNNKRTSIEIDLSPESFVQCIEELILQKITSQMKKMKLKLNDMEVKIVSDNHQFIFTHLNFSNFSYQSKNDFNYYCDSNKVKLLKSWAEVKIQDLILSSYKKEKVILDLQNFTLNLTEDIIYYHQSREGSIRGTVNSETPSVDIIMSTKELDKIIELIICIVSGFEKLEAHSERNVYIHKYIEKYVLQTFLNLNFEKVNLTVYDETIQTEVSNISLNVRVEEEKFSGSKVDIIFSPISVCVFSKSCTKYSSNVLVRGFKLNIVDDLKTSRIDILFEDTKVVCYDNHLIDVLKFVAEFLTYCLKGGVKNTHKKKTKINSGYKNKYTNIIPKDEPSKKKEVCTLFFKKAIVYNYIDFDDILTFKVKDYTFYIDDWMMIPKVKIYHQSTTNGFLKKRTQFITVERFYIKFVPDNHECLIDFGHIIVNAYCFELAFVIAKVSIYHSFLPVWINYHMSYKHSLDDDYRKIYVADFAKKDRCLIKFGRVDVKINQYAISNCAVFQTNPELMYKEMSEKFSNQNQLSNLTGNNNLLNNGNFSSSSEINYLKNLKCDQITINVKNFVLSTWGFKEKESTNENLYGDDCESGPTRNISYYKKITKSK
jgi:hypothetical protein